ncbi:transketolase C-terminal domain-containing protein [Neorhizobium sp. JUb45]|uniref:transketolase family protein n=1 Tax=Neorhizobium sp. JUb45 TaxID=2485113 RepID=UPI00104FA2A8|nr:transketolase C-terminal domain-containing protein [Neorhizobium sp. JUb45]TCR03916.1 transketolase subunit B [Neorhizobium sp. JUb45]
MRNTFINTLCDLAEKHDDIFLLCGDLGYSVLEPFAARYPDRFLNAGIAEQNMTQVAAGLAREGYNVFTYSIGNFPTLRAMEQVRYDVCYHAANVKVVAVGAGYAYGPQGVSHHTTEDIAMLRALPGMTVCAPADAGEARAAALFMANHVGPGYVRLNKSGEPVLHDASRPVKMAPGEFVPVKDGQGTLVLATGAIVTPMLIELRDNSLDWALWSAPFIGGYNRETLVSMSHRFQRIVTVEEHQLSGGFGSSIIEALSDLYATGVLRQMPKVERIGVPNTFISTSGTQEYLRQVAGLTLANVSR